MHRVSAKITGGAGGANTIKIALAISSFLLLPSSAWSAPTFVDYTTHTCTDVPCYPSESTSFVYLDVQEGSLLVVATSTSSTGTCTISSPGESWSHDVHAVNSSGVTISLDIWSLPDASGGDETIYVDCTGGETSIRVVAAQFSGVASSGHVMATSSNTGYGDVVDAGSVTTDADDAVLFAATRTDSDLQGWSASSGYTMINDCNAELEPDQKLCMEMSVSVAAGTYSGNFSIDSDSWVAGVVAFAPDGGGSPSDAGADGGTDGDADADGDLDGADGDADVDGADGDGDGDLDVDSDLDTDAPDSDAPSRDENGCSCVAAGASARFQVRRLLGLWSLLHG